MSYNRYFTRVNAYVLPSIIYLSLQKTLATKSFQFIADTINGVIQEFPAPFYFPCDQIVPLGIQVVRDFDEDLCIVAKRVYVIRYGQDLFGSTQFADLNSFMQYRNAGCRCCSGCDSYVLVANGCFLTINGCHIVIKPCQGIVLKANGCYLTINGCTINLN